MRLGTGPSLAEAVPVPQVTVAIAVGSTSEVSITLESILGQKGVTFEIIAVCNGSIDSAALLARPSRDPRVRPIRGASALSCACWRNLAIEASRGPLLTFLSAGDCLLPGALAKMVAVLAEDRSVGLAHGYWFPVDELGRVSKLDLRKRRSILLKAIPSTLDHRRALIVQGNIIQAAPTYRREVLITMRGFNELGDTECDYEMALRLLDYCEIRLIPKFVCARHDRSRSETIGAGWRSYLRSVALARRVTMAKPVRFLRSPAYRFERLILRGLVYNLGDATLIERARRFMRSLEPKARVVARRLRYAVGRLYQYAVDRFGWWPIAWFDRRGCSARPESDHDCVAYVFWRYPILSETFVRREIEALREANIAVQIVADAPDEPYCPPGPALDQTTVIYLEPIDKARSKRLFAGFALRRPLALLNLFVYVVFHRYQANKSPYADIDLIFKAALLAGVLDQRGVTHVHAPWADAHAFLALIAARLLRIPYSVHVRAHEIHSASFNYALKEKLTCSSFVVTNSGYNEAHLRPLLAQSAPERLHVIYNGIDLRQFTPVPQRDADPTSFAILAVGRLVEQKGFAILLRACRKLLERGLVFNCDIIGGLQNSDANTYVLLKKLHRRLELDDNVRFLGAQPFRRVLEAYTRADLFVLPCVVAADGSRDVTPNVLIEAMAMQLPVVSTPVGAIPEIVNNGVEGVLVSPNDENSLADAIEILSGDPDLRRRLGLAARKKVENRFDISKNVQRYAALFRTMGQPHAERGH